LTAVTSEGKILVPVLVQSSSFMKKSVHGDETACLRKCISLNAPRLKRNPFRVVLM